MRGARWLIALAIALTALNLRTAVTSVGALIEELTDGLHMSGTVAGLLTALPVLAFAFIGGLSPAMARRVGEHQLLAFGMLAMVAGLVGRAVAPNPWIFLVFSVVALSGGAIGNVIIPSQVKRHFPRHIGRMTAMYTGLLSAGQAAAAAVTVPIAHVGSGGHWRIGLGVWAAVAVLGFLPWLPLISGVERPTSAPARVSTRRLLRSPMAWGLLGLFAMQSAQAYVAFGWFVQFFRDEGLSAQDAGFLIGFMLALGIPVSFIAPPLAARMRDHRALLLVFVAMCVAGYVGMLTLGETGAIVWVALLGVGYAVFPLVLVLLGLRTRAPETTAALSAFVQGGGYILAGIGPLLVGALYEVTGGWTWPFVFLLATTAVEVPVCLIVGRPRFVDDEIGVAAQPG